ncbi:MAG: hypothetical protein M3R65_03240 [Gemmatimonadota bacterium]|nr:hypothetical protein [Gemmatimonadota bacterium]
MNEDENADRVIRMTLLESRRPPEAPIDEMWAVIEKRVFSGTRLVPLRATRFVPWQVPAMAAAAALVIGVAMGWSLAPRTTITHVVAGSSNAAPPAVGGIAIDTRAPDSLTTSVARNAQLAPHTHSHSIDAVAGPSMTALAKVSTQPRDVGALGGSDMARYLTQTSALLASLPSDRSSQSDTAIAARAADLLTQTHLLLDSRAGSDPTLHRLLEDLELVLAQVARLRGRGNASDLQFIRQALTVHDVIPRVHDATLEASTTD